MDNTQRLATAMLAVFLPGSCAPGVEYAIRLELLVTALQDVEHPRTLCDLLVVLDRLRVGDVALDLLFAVRQYAEGKPEALLQEFVA